MKKMSPITRRELLQQVGAGLVGSGFMHATVTPEFATFPAENLVRIQIIDVGPIPLLSSSSYAHSVCIRLCRSLLLHPDAGGSAIGGRRSPPPN
jgi:hypothetical protein